MSHSHNQKRYDDLQNLLAEQYEKLAAFERDHGITADTARKFELAIRIKEIKQTIQSLEAELTQLQAKIGAPASSSGDKQTAAIDLAHLLEVLTKITEVDFGKLVFLLRGGKEIPSDGVPQATRAVKLLEWAESHDRLPELVSLLETKILHRPL